LFGELSLEDLVRPQVHCRCKALIAECEWEDFAPTMNEFQIPPGAFVAVRDVLISDWNINSVEDAERSRDEYDIAILPIFKILIATRSERELADLLHQIVVKDFGKWDGIFYRRRNKRVAQKLLAIPNDILSGKRGSGDDFKGW
jgi:hypothetical protein